MLARNPKHAEALVWRGAARVYQSGQLFAAGKASKAMPLWNGRPEGHGRRGQALEPDNVGVRIPRAVGAAAGRPQRPAGDGPAAVEESPGPTSRRSRRGKSASKDFDKLGTHPRGELRMGLADTYRLMGDAEKSKAQLEAVLKDLPDTKYAKRATEWLAAKPDAKLTHNCIGCHTK